MTALLTDIHVDFVIGRITMNVSVAAKTIRSLLNSRNETHHLVVPLFSMLCVMPVMWIVLIPHVL